MPLINKTTSGRQAAVWNVDKPDSVKPAESAILPSDGSHEGESIIGADGRTAVALEDIQDGGKYRSVVKILSCFANKDTGEDVWMMGTGWLIRPDLLITAGHVVYDWGHRLGATTQIKCYIGYRGRASVKSGGSCQARYATTIITTAEWLRSADNRDRDVAFIQVNAPFTGKLNNFTFSDTKSKDTAELGIVGYPADKSLDNKEDGGEMYEQYKSTTYDISKSSRHMIEYQISTFGGQSGAPIISRKGKTLDVIGTHCYGGGGTENNSGNSIGGDWGNPYYSFISLLTLDHSTFGTASDISQVAVSGTGGGKESESASADGEEGFLDVFKTVARIGSSVAPLAGGLLGPAGGIIGTVAGGILGSLSEATAAATESELADNGAAERALLAEACLGAVLRLPKDHPIAKKIIGHMTRNYNLHAPNIDAIAAAITPAVTGAAVDITSDRYSQVLKQGVPTGREPLLPAKPLGVTAPESAFGEGSGFVEGLFGPTRPVPGAEGFFDWVGPVLNTAVSVATPIVSSAAKTVITDVAPKLLNQVVGSLVGGAGGPPARGTESADVTEGILAQPVLLSQKTPQVRLLLKRALVADAALQALQSLPADQLKGLKVMPATPGGQTEGFFDSIKSAVQKMGPSVLSTAKAAAKTIAPVLIQAAANKASDLIGVPSESTTVPNGQDAPAGLVKQQSVLDGLLDGVSAATEVSPRSNPVHVMMAMKSHAAAEEEPLNLGAELKRREREWVPSEQPRKEWDDNDDLPRVFKGTPPADP
ncbi:hypothetical protein UVI_02015580 [Ustilaginoidea virens]|uniref:Serine protease n=1 Tax=Ustilaginoidea virens TaxID=1159556 RepID=A0A1B5KRX2_USTVR|nr:hypothetical protein UVI_02015580 [Ustilaginoidea virens]